MASSFFKSIKGFDGPACVAGFETTATASVICFLRILVSDGSADDAIAFLLAIVAVVALVARWGWGSVISNDIVTVVEEPLRTLTSSLFPLSLSLSFTAAVAPLLLRCRPLLLRLPVVFTFFASLSRSFVASRVSRSEPTPSLLVNLLVSLVLLRAGAAIALISWEDAVVGRFTSLPISRVLLLESFLVVISVVAARVFLTGGGFSEMVFRLPPPSIS